MFILFLFFATKKKALLEISRPIQFSKTVQPICISSNAQNKTYDNEVALIAGWGNLAEEFDVGMYIVTEVDSTFALRFTDDF